MKVKKPPSRLSAGTLVVLKDGRKINVKEKIDKGVFEGNDVETHERCYFLSEDIESVIKN